MSGCGTKEIGVRITLIFSDFSGMNPVGSKVGGPRRISDGGSWLSDAEMLLYRVAKPPKQWVFYNPEGKKARYRLPACEDHRAER